jgi:hypothetical protein
MIEKTRDRERENKKNHLTNMSRSSQFSYDNVVPETAKMVEDEMRKMKAIRKGDDQPLKIGTKKKKERKEKDILIDNVERANPLGTVRRSREKGIARKHQVLVITSRPKLISKSCSVQSRLEP